MRHIADVSSVLSVDEIDRYYNAYVYETRIRLFSTNHYESRVRCQHRLPTELFAMTRSTVQDVVTLFKLDVRTLWAWARRD